MQYHLGWDIVGISSKEIVSVSSGIVKAAGSSDPKSSGFGIRVWVYDADNDVSIIYAHMSSVSCKVGDRVTCKTPLGIMGSTGRSTGPHLHIGIFRGSSLREDASKAINPAYYFSLAEEYSLTGKYLDGYGLIENRIEVYDNESEVEEAFSSNELYRASSGNFELSSEYYTVVEGTGKYLDVLYGRRYRILISDESGFTLDVSNLRCKFNINKDWNNYSATSDITIYNLNAEDENRIIKTAKTVYVEAGYSGRSSYGLIYVGTVIQVLRSKSEGTDYLLTLVLANSSNFNIQSVLGVTVNSEANMRKVISEIANKSGNITKTNYGMSLGKIAETADYIKLPRGKVLFGRSSKILDQISNTLNSTVYIENGIINIISPEDVEEDTIFDIGPETGLIESPTQTDNGVSIKCLINPQLGINKLFHLDNSSVNTARYNFGESFIPLDTQGIYRIISLNYVGDTRGNEWYVEVKALSQIGALPSISSNANTVIK